LGLVSLDSGAQHTLDVLRLNRTRQVAKDLTYFSLRQPSIGIDGRRDSFHQCVASCPACSKPRGNPSNGPPLPDRPKAHSIRSLCLCRFSGLPLHVAWLGLTTPLEGNDVIDEVTGTRA
jgi:hypothetical protein